MGVLVDLFEDIRGRLQTAITSGSLTLVKRLVVVPKTELRKLNDYPIINMSMGDGEEEPTCMPHTFTDIMTIKIILYVNKLAGESNGLYDTSNNTGFLFLFEDLLNVLDKDIAGNINLVFSGKANNLRQYPYTIDYINNDSVIVGTINILVESKKFQAGDR